MRDFAEQELDLLRTQLERQINAPRTSSMGRLFDAAASLAGVRQRVNYEAQAAIEFEALVDASETTAYPFDIGADTIGILPVVHSLLEDVRVGVPIPVIAARFHNGIAALVAAASTRLRAATGIQKVALSGGVWQNITLLRRTLSLLREQDFQVYIHREVPANDGGLSLGQAAIAASRLRAGHVPGSTGKNHQDP